MKAFNFANQGRAPFEATVMTVAGVQAIVMPYMHPVDMRETDPALITDALRCCANQGVFHADLKPAHVGQFSAKKGARPVGFTDFGRHTIFEAVDEGARERAFLTMKKTLFP